MTVKATEMNELMTKLDQQKAVCVCELEQCNFCPDCGYSYPACTYTPCHWPNCYCDDHIGCSFTPTCSPNTPYDAWSCATVDSNTADFTTAYTAHPCSGDTNPPTDVPWNCMCNYSYPGQHSWSGTYYGHNRATDWGCKCSPFVNTGHTCPAH